jgi:hypothetical protein
MSQRGILLLALLGLVLGSKYLSDLSARRRLRREHRAEIQSWEDEGGAVPNPTTPAPTAASDPVID